MLKTSRHALPSRVFLGFLLFIGLAGVSFAQNDIAGPNGSAGYVRMPVAAIDNSTGQPVGSAPLLVFPDGADTSKGSFSSDANTAGSGPGGSAPIKTAAITTSSVGGVMTGLDTVPTFTGAFFNPNPSILGTRPNGVFPFVMIGNDPRVGKTTRIPAKITEVSLRLLNDDGTLRATMPFAPFSDLTEDSPNFAPSNFTSGRHIQYGDAIHRAQFFNSMDEDWHTVLSGPTTVNRVTFTIPRHVNVRLPNGTIVSVQAYLFGHAPGPNGDPFIELLDLLFNALNTNQVVNDINAGNFTTDAININMYPNTFLFSINSQGQFAGCCVLGFHTYFFESGVTPQPRWIFNFASWISPGLFGAGFQDVTALSHEIAETIADPFVNTIVPTWQFPGVAPTAKVCQANLEEGDPIEVLPVATVPILLRERKEVFTYHPQIIPLLQWFEMGAKSDAIGGAFSYPDTTTLPHSALPCPQ
ncbi:MAG TPA: hypothetical protein VE604_05265 [Candidatus Polarisedimenticolia bacterium]|jgi:hypothetical protein|nr:hypothetical protein [Candidatus Polarisedimenticolia bacterium]